MSVTEYASHAGCDYGTIYRNIRSGLLADAIASREPTMIDSDIADTIFVINTNKQTRTGSGQAKNSKKKAGKIKNKPIGAKKKFVAGKKKVIEQKKASNEISIAEAKRLIEIIKLESAQIDLDLKKKNCFLKDDIESVWYQKINLMKIGITNMTYRTAPLLWGCDNQHDVLMTLLKATNDLLSQWSDVKAHGNLKNFKQLVKAGKKK